MSQHLDLDVPRDEVFPNDWSRYKSLTYMKIRCPPVFDPPPNLTHLDLNLLQSWPSVSLQPMLSVTRLTLHTRSFGVPLGSLFPNLQRLETSTSHLLQFHRLEAMELGPSTPLEGVSPILRFLVCDRQPSQFPSSVVCFIAKDFHPKPKDFSASNCLIIMSEPHYKRAKLSMRQRATTDVAFRDLLGSGRSTDLLSMILILRRDKFAFDKGILRSWIRRHHLQMEIIPLILRIFPRTRNTESML